MPGAERKRPRRSRRRPDVRALAAKLLEQVVAHGRSLDRVFTGARVAERDQPLLQELVHGTVRHYWSLSALVTQTLDHPLRQRDDIVRLLLIVGAYQLGHTRIPDHAAVAETVAAAAHLGKPWAKGLVNQILRSIAAGEQPLPSAPEARFDHPAWLIDAVRAQYPDTWQSILEENNQRAPMTLRVNQRRGNVTAYRARLAAAGIDARPGLTDATLVLTAPVAAETLPGYADGDVSVQDDGAQLVAGLLDVHVGHRVLDACAAPGGKACHILESYDDVALVAVERDADRCQVVEREHRRLGLPPLQLLTADATTLDWWDGVRFDRILIDAPCSGTGTLRRHPDIKLLKKPNDLAAFHAIQSKLLATLWQCLAPRGRLLYCTCSLLDEENDAVIAEFLAAHDDASSVVIEAPWGHATGYGRQLLPAHDGNDGFYFAMIERTNA
jgi:16S rRNA (cytosine967-C5)-methyltransferase